jgi:hypothetical protein
VATEHEDENEKEITANLQYRVEAVHGSFHSIGQRKGTVSDNGAVSTKDAMYRLHAPGRRKSGAVVNSITL